MDKKIVGITLLITALFAVGGVILKAPAHLDPVVDKDSYSGNNWSLSASASAGESGANASASPSVTIDESVQATVTCDFSGNATAHAERGGNSAFFPHHENDDSGDIYAKIKIRNGTVTVIVVPKGKKVKVKFEGGDGEYITAGAEIEIEEGKIIEQYSYTDWFVVPGSNGTLSRSVSVSGPPLFAKSSSVNGSFEGTSFNHSASYTRYHAH